MSKHKKAAARSRRRSGPGYNFTALYLKSSFVLAWTVILALVIGGLLGSDKADRLADIIVPSMVALIAVNLGIHRGFGALDYRANKAAEATETEAEEAYGSRYRESEK